MPNNSIASDDFAELDDKSCTYIFNRDYLFSKNQITLLKDNITIKYSDILWLCDGDSLTNVAHILSAASCKIIKKSKIPFLFFKNSRNYKILEIFTKNEHFQIRDYKNGEWGKLTLNKKKKCGTSGYQNMVNFLKTKCENAVYSQGYSELAENKYREKIGLPKIQKTYYEKSAKNNEDL